MEEAGGKCLPCAVDIRNEVEIQKAMKEAADKFGGIDILVNNASAISLTGTAVTEPKRYDLMMGVNARGTYMWSVLNQLLSFALIFFILVNALWVKSKRHHQFFEVLHTDQCCS